MQLDFPRRWPAYASVIVALLLLALSLVPGALESLAVGESGPAETLTALSYALACVLAAWAAFNVRGWRRAHLCFWAIFAIVLFGEETSWLQHQIGYATPEWLADANVQGEANLHNLRGLHGGKFLEDETNTPWLGKLLGAQNLFQLGFFGYFLLLPVLALIPAALDPIRRISLPYAGPRLAIFIWSPIFAALALSFLTAGQTKVAAAELREMFYAVAILAFVFLLARSAWAEPPNLGTGKIV